MVLCIFKYYLITMKLFLTNKKIIPIKKKMRQNAVMTNISYNYVSNNYSNVFYFCFNNISNNFMYVFISIWTLFFMYCFN